jgi:hypothetical protein
MENKVVGVCSESGSFVLYSLISLSSCVDVDPSCLPAGDGQRSGCGLCACQARVGCAGRDWGWSWWVMLPPLVSAAQRCKVRQGGVG